MKTDNQIISDARGDKERTKTKHSCGQSWITIYYDIDPAAWTPEFYQWIEDEGLKGYFAGYLEGLIYKEHKSIDTWTILSKSTPAQKASALAKAIKANR